MYETTIVLCAFKTKSVQVSKSSHPKSAQLIHMYQVSPVFYLRY